MNAVPAAGIGALPRRLAGAEDAQRMRHGKATAAWRYLSTLKLLNRISRYNNNQLIIATHIIPVCLALVKTRHPESSCVSR